MQARHSPQASQAAVSASAWVAASSASVTSTPSTTHEPWRRVIAIVFFPGTAMPDRTAASRSTCQLASTWTTNRAPRELAQVLAQRAQPVAEHGVLVAAGVPGQPPARLVAGLGRLRARVAVRRGHHRARVAQQQLGMARAVGAAHREAHVGEQPALAALEDRPLGPPVRLGPADAAGGELQAVGLGQDGGGQLARLHPVTVDVEPQPSPAGYRPTPVHRNRQGDSR